MKSPYQRLLIAAIILTVYIPAITAGLSHVDDTGIISWLLNSDGVGLNKIFFPEGAIGHYYRPLVMASYLADKYFWFADERFMHLENIILHLINTLLVYQLAIQLIKDADNHGQYVALCTAFAFGLHPVNTESVSWICGRSDLLAGLFVLSTAVLILRFRNAGGKINLLFAAITFSSGILCKEVTLAFLPGIWLLLQADNHHRQASGGGRPVRNMLVIAIIVMTAVAGVFFWSRFSAMHTGSALGDTFTYAKINPTHALFIFFRAFGFYAKKIIQPFPLNFTIYEVDPLYELLAIPLIFLSGVILFRRSLLSAVFVSGVLLMAPSFLIALNRIAWTAYAERYVYIPSAFIICAVVAYCDAKLRRLGMSRVAASVAAIILIIWSGGVLQRSFLWSDSLKLLKDSVDKNPTFYMVRNNYGELLMDKGDLTNARIQFEMSNTQFPNEQAELNLGELLYREGRAGAAIAHYRKMIAESGGGSINAYDRLIALLEKQLLQASDDVTQRTVVSGLLQYRQKRDELGRDPNSIYRMGQLSLALGEKKMAVYYFRLADTLFADGDTYKGYCRKLISRLEA